jgi:hypothetical protein
MMNYRLHPVLLLAILAVFENKPVLGASLSSSSPFFTVKSLPTIDVRVNNELIGEIDLKIEQTIEGDLPDYLKAQGLSSSQQFLAGQFTAQPDSNGQPRLLEQITPFQIVTDNQDF